MVTRPFIKGREAESVVTEISLSSRISALKDLLKTFGLGKITSAKTSLKSGDEYEQYWDKSQMKGKAIYLGDGDTSLTLEFMERIVKDSLSQTKAIAQNLSLIIKLQNEYLFSAPKI